MFLTPAVEQAVTSQLGSNLANFSRVVFGQGTILPTELAPSNGQSSERLKLCWPNASFLAKFRPVTS